MRTKSRRETATNGAITEEPATPPWEYQPETRHLLVEEYFRKKGKVSCLLACGIGDDRDLLQYLEFRQGGQCEDRDAYTFALDAHSRNLTQGLGSLVRAMIAARIPRDEIAGYLHVTPSAITAYKKTFWSLPDLGADDFMRRFINRRHSDQISRMEAFLFHAALECGRHGIEMVFTPEVGLWQHQRTIVEDILSSDALRRKNAKLPAAPEVVTAENDSHDRLIVALKQLTLQPPPKAKYERQRRFAEVMSAVAGGVPVINFLNVHGLR